MSSTEWLRIYALHAVVGAIVLVALLLGLCLLMLIVPVPHDLLLNNKYSVQTTRILVSKPFMPWLLQEKPSTSKVAGTGNLEFPPFNSCTFTYNEAQSMNKYHITVVTPWIRSLLFQLTMADPVKVMQVTPN